MVSIDINGKSIYYDDRLYRNLLEIKDMLQKKDQMFILVIDGDPGTGKSTLAQQIASIPDPTYPMTASQKTHNIVENYTQAAISCEKNSAQILDEALNGTNARRAMSGLNVFHQQFVGEIRQRNLLLIYCAPSIFDLDRTIVLNYANALIHCYTKWDGNRYFRFFGKQAMKQLYLNPENKRTYSYRTRSTFYGKFKDGYVMNEKEYRKFKSEALKKYITKDSLKNMVSPEEAIKKREAEIYAKLLATGKISLNMIAKAGVADQKTIKKRLQQLNDEGIEETKQEESSIVRREDGENFKDDKET